MYYFLEEVIIDEKNHFLFAGELYNEKKSRITEVFDNGSTVQKELTSPFLFILNESRSLTKKRTYIDKVSSSARGAGFLFLVSPKVQKMFMKLLSHDVQIYDVHIKSSSFELYDYKIVKIKNKIDCIDLEKSDVDYDVDYDCIDSAKKIVLNTEKIPTGKQIFLLGKRETAVIMIHEDLKKAIEVAGLTGFKFYPLDEAYMVIS